MTDPTPSTVEGVVVNSSDEAVETRPATVHGRVIQVRKLGDAQGPLLARELLMVRKATADPFRRVQATARVFDILESVVVSEEDRDFLMDLNLVGDLRMTDMMNCLAVWSDEEQPKSKGPAVVRRGRPRRTG